MSSIVNKAKDALGVSKGEGMSGIGPDQNALQDSSMGTNEEREKYEAKYGTAHNETGSSMGGIGPVQDALDDDSLRKYESKYGKADESFAKGHDASKTMAGIGSDQSALQQE